MSTACSLDILSNFLFYVSPESCQTRPLRRPRSPAFRSQTRTRRKRSIPRHQEHPPSVVEILRPMHSQKVLCHLLILIMTIYINEANLLKRIKRFPNFVTSIPAKILSSETHFLSVNDHLKLKANQVNRDGRFPRGSRSLV